MHYVGSFVVVLLNSVWLVCSVVGLPGNWLMLLTAVFFAWLSPGGVQMFGKVSLLTALGLAVTGEAAELLAGSIGTKRAGGSSAASAASLVGAIVGGVVATFTLPIPLIGSLVGVCVGAFVAAMAVELWIGRGVGPSLRSARGAAWGRFWGTMAKLLLGAAIWMVLGVAAFWP